MRGSRHERLHLEEMDFEPKTGTANLGVDDNQTAVRGVLKAGLFDGFEIVASAAYWTRDAQGGGAFAGRIQGTLLDPASGLRSFAGVPYAVNPTVIDGSVRGAGRPVGVAVTFMKKALKRHRSPEAIVTDDLRSYRAAMTELGNRNKQEVRRWANNRAEISHLPFQRRRERAKLRLGRTVAV